MSQPPESPLSTAMLVIAAGRRLQERLEDRLAELGLTLRLFGALGHIARDADLSHSDLARRAGVTTQSMRATVLVLEERGTVARNVAGQGHRARLELTDHGRALLAEARAVVSRMDDELAVDAGTAGAAAEICRRAMALE